MANVVDPSVDERLAMIAGMVAAGTPLDMALSMANVSVDALVSYLPSSVQGSVVALLLRAVAQPNLSGSMRQPDVSGAVADLDARLSALENRR